MPRPIRYCTSSFKFQFIGMPRQAIRAWCSCFRYCPNPLGNVTAVQISVCRADDRCHFLVPAQESNQIKRLKGTRPSSRSTRVPLKNPPAPSPEERCKTAGRRERSRRHEQGHDDVPSRRESVTQAFRCVRERYIGEGAFVARERGISASPMAASLGHLSCRNKKGAIL